MKKIIQCGSVILLLLSVGTLNAQQPGIKRTELQRQNLSAEGKEAIQVAISFAPGSSFPNHVHPGEELIYVLEGSIEYKVEGKLPVTLKAGEVLFIPAGTIHAARNTGKRTAVELATYIVEKGKPLITKEK